jgi:hypothetical protein
MVQQEKLKISLYNPIYTQRRTKTEKPKHKIICGQMNEFWLLRIELLLDVVRIEDEL